MHIEYTEVCHALIGAKYTYVQYLYAYSLYSYTIDHIFSHILQTTSSLPSASAMGVCPTLIGAKTGLFAGPGAGW